MKTDKVSIILPYNDKLEILFQDRRKISKRGEEYGFFGGHLEPGETPDQALAREVREELNLDTKKLKVKFFKKFVFEMKEWDVIGERSVYLIKLQNLKDIKANEGQPVVIKFEDVFKLKLSPEMISC